MRGFSKVVIAGNLVRDPELRSTSAGTSVCSFSVAVNRSYRAGDGSTKDSVSYFDCSAWSKLGETIAEYAKKGTGILLSGRLNQRTWEDKTGSKRSSVEIVVEDFNFIGGGSRDGGSYSSSSAGSNASSAPASAPANQPDIPTDIPDEEIDLSEIPF